MDTPLGRMTVGLPSTLGGPGWTPRQESHGAEMAAGHRWSRCGYRSEVAPLRAVLLSRPPDSVGLVTDSRAQLMTSPIDLGRLRDQAEAVAEAFRGRGVAVHWASPPPDAPPNVIFQRDLFLVTPRGAILGRTASEQRAGEERHAALALATAGVPILHTVRGTATFEGADALWVDERTVVVARGFRTNADGVRTVAEVLREESAEVVPVELGPHVQHLLGSLVPIDHRRALLYTPSATPALREVLRARDYELIEIGPDPEVVHRRGLNLVALRPGSVLMPAGCPRTRQRLEAAGIEVSAVEVGEYVKAAGALGCLTGILHRDDDTGLGGGD